MRHDQIAATESYRITPFPPETVAATASSAPNEQTETFRSAPAMPDVPVGVGRMIVACYVAMVIVFALGLGGARDINFALTIVGLFVVIYFTLPRILLGVAPSSGTRPSLERFLSEGMMTNTGWTGGKAALVQILIVPVCLMLAAIAMMVITRAMV